MQRTFLQGWPREAQPAHWAVIASPVRVSKVITSMPLEWLDLHGETDEGGNVSRL